MRRRRHDFPADVREAALARANEAGGTCECGCGFPLTVGKYEFHHALEDALGGPATLENCRVLAKGCHVRVTSERAPVLAKVERQRRAHLDLATASRTPLPGGRFDRLKRRIGGGVVERATGAPVGSAP